MSYFILLFYFRFSSPRVHQVPVDYQVKYRNKLVIQYFIIDFIGTPGLPGAIGQKGNLYI